MFTFKRLAMSLTLGAKLGPYEILAAIGAGGMGGSTRPWTPSSAAKWPSKSCRKPSHKMKNAWRAYGSRTFFVTNPAGRMIERLTRFSQEWGPNAELHGLSH